MAGFLSRCFFYPITTIKKSKLFCKSFRLQSALCCARVNERDFIKWSAINLNANDLTQGSIIKGLLRFFFPILFGMLFQQLYNTVDAIVVGRVVGHEALAAVGGSPAVIINLVIGIFTGLASGATVIISQYFGSHDDDLLSRA
ncbi:MAG: hypothetical protein IJU66_04440, partial [Oscillospiraceae bacterium]|nr:hypothetical protein [Oscillospiraceae bacterium]